MKALEFASRTEIDLWRIYESAAANNVAAARKLLTRLRKTCRFIGRNPHIGTARNEILSGLRAYSVGSYVIYFRERPAAIRIERILHGARDVETAFDDDVEE